MRQGPSVLSSSGASAKSATAITNAEQSRTRTGRICDGIYWAVSDARADKSTGYVGQRVPFNHYVVRIMDEAMRKWS